MLDQGNDQCGAAVYDGLEERSKLPRICNAWLGTSQLFSNLLVRRFTIEERARKIGTKVLTTVEEYNGMCVHVYQWSDDSCLLARRVFVCGIIHDADLALEKSGTERSWIEKFRFSRTRWVWRSLRWLRDVTTILNLLLLHFVVC